MANPQKGPWNAKNPLHHVEPSHQRPHPCVQLRHINPDRLGSCLSSLRMFLLLGVVGRAFSPLPWPLLAWRPYITAQPFLNISTSLLVCSLSFSHSFLGATTLREDHSPTLCWRVRVLATQSAFCSLSSFLPPLRRPSRFPISIMRTEG